MNQPAPVQQIPATEMNIVSLTLRVPLNLKEFEGLPVDEAVGSISVLVPFALVMEAVNLVGIKREYELDVGYVYEVNYELPKFAGYEVERVSDELNEEIQQAFIEQYRRGGDAA